MAGELVYFSDVVQVEGASVLLFFVCTSVEEEVSAKCSKPASI